MEKCIAKAVESARRQAKFPAKNWIPAKGVSLSRKLAAAAENIVRCADDGKYYFRIGNRWQKASGGAEINRTLKMEYGIKLREKGAEISEVDTVLHHCFRENNVYLVFQSISGYKAGEHSISGRKVLCAEEMPLVEPKDADCGTIVSFLECFTNRTDSPDQLDFLLSWLSLQIKDLYAIYHDGVPISATRPVGQVLFLVGPSGGGKSFFANQILKMLFNGVVADPFQFLNNRDNRFNSELFSSPLLLCDDTLGSPRNEDRKAQAQKLKGLMSGSPIRYEAKGKEAISITPYWRIVYLMNDDEYSFNAFPDIIDGFKERTIALKAGDIKWEEFGKKSRKDMERTISAEIPGFINLLLKYEIPESVCDERFGCKPYLHPTIETAAFERTPEAMLLHAILDLADGEECECTAKELMNDLRTKSDYFMGSFFEKMGTDSFGRKLASLCRMHPNTVRRTEKRRGNAFVYIIFPQKCEK
jgi:ABC-type dipeptide/oligopeptide/nickel transport system ATPase component